MRICARATAVFISRIFVIVVLGFALTGPSVADQLASVSVVSAVSVLMAALEATLFYVSLSYWREQKSGRPTRPSEITVSYMIAGGMYLGIAVWEASREPTGWLGLGAVFGGCFAVPGVIAAWLYARRIGRPAVHQSS